MVSETGLLSSTCENKLAQAIEINTKVVFVDGKSMPEMQNFLRAKVVQ